MAYVEWHGGISDHHKTAWLRDFLKVNIREAVGVRGCLYEWAIVNRPGGYIERELLSFACKWDGDKALLERSLLDAKLLDAVDETRVYIHDWPEYTRGYRKARKDATRKKRAYLRSIRGDSTESRGDQNRPDQSGPERDGAAWLPSSPLGMLLEEARRQKVRSVGGKQLRQQIEGWHAQKGFEFVQELLMSGKVKGMDVLDISRSHFSISGKEIVDQLFKERRDASGPPRI